MAGKKSDFTLVVGADVAVSTEQLRVDIQSIISNLDKDPPRIKLNFDFDDDDLKDAIKSIVTSFNKDLSGNKVDLGSAFDDSNIKSTLSNTDKQLQTISQDLRDILRVVTHISSKSMSLNFGNIFKKEQMDVTPYKRELEEYVKYSKEAENALISLTQQHSKTSRSLTRDTARGSLAAAIVNVSGGTLQDLVGRMQESRKRSEELIGREGVKLSTLRNQISEMRQINSMITDIAKQTEERLGDTFKIDLPDSSGIEEAMRKTEEEEKRIEEVNKQLAEQKKLAQENISKNGSAGILSSLTNGSQEAADALKDVANQAEGTLSQVGQQAEKTASQTKSAVEQVGEQAKNSTQQAASAIEQTSQQVTKAVEQTGSSLEQISQQATNISQRTGNALDQTGQSLVRLVRNVQPVSSALEGLKLSLTEIDDDKVRSITKGLVKDGLKEDDAKAIAEDFRGLTGVIKQCKVEYQDFGKYGEHVTSLLVKTANEAGTVFGKKIKWLPQYNDDGEIIDFEKISSGFVQMDKVVQTTEGDIGKTLLELGEYQEKINTVLKDASDIGLPANEAAIQNLANLRDEYDGLETMLLKGDISLEHYNATTENSNEVIDSYISKVNQLILAKEDEAKALAEAIRLKRDQVQLEKQINQVNTKISTDTRDGISPDSESTQKLTAYKNELQELNDSIGKTTNSHEEYSQKLLEINSRYTDLEYVRKEAIADVREEAAAVAEAIRLTRDQVQLQKQISQIDSKISSDTRNGIATDSESTQKLIAYKNELQELNDSIGKTTNSHEEYSQKLLEIEKRYTSLEHIRKEAIADAKEEAQAQKELKNSEKTYDALTSAVKDYSLAQGDSSQAVKEAYQNIVSLVDEYEKLAAGLKSGDKKSGEFAEGIRQINKSLEENKAVLNEAGYGVDGLKDGFASLAANVTRFITPFYLVRKAVSIVKNMANTVIELEDAFAQLQIVTRATDSELEAFYQTASEIATNLGKSITDIAASIEVFSRLGYALPDATTLAEYATILSNVANVTTDDATTGLTSIIKGYNLHVEQAEHVSDVLVSIGQKYAVSAGEMMEAYQRAGAALAATNTSFDKSAAIIAAANAAVQNSSIVGTALKTVSARIRGSKTDLEELGEYTEDLADGFSKYAKELKGITGVNILVEGTTDQFRDLYDIFNDIAAVWDRLTDTQQARASEILGGTRQLQVISSIIHNWNDAERALQDAQNATGEAARANNIYMDTTTAHINQFKAAFQDLSNTLISSGTLKFFVDFGTVLIKLTTTISKFLGIFGGITPILLAVTGAIVAFNPKLITLAGSAIASALRLDKLSQAVGTLSFSFEGLASGLSTLPGLIGGITAVAAVIATVVSAYNSWKAAEEDRRRASITAGEELAEEGEELYSLTQKYLKLDEAGSNNAETLAARDEVIEKLGLEQTELNELIAQYGSYEEAIKRATTQKLKEQRVDLVTAYEASKEQLEEGSGKKNLTRLNRAWNSGTSSSNPYAVDFGDLSTYDGVLSAYDKLREEMDRLIDAGMSGSAVYNELADIYADMSGDVEAYRTALGNAIDNEIELQALMLDSPTDIDSYIKFRDEIINAVYAEEMFKDTSYDVAAAVDNFLSKQDGMSEFANALSGSASEALKEYDSIVSEIRNKNIDLSKTVFGNIDTNQRQILQWTEDNLAKYADAIRSWGLTASQLAGSISTTLGMSNEYDGVEIAFSPILQTAEGPVLLSQSTVDKYIGQLITNAGEGWTNEDLFKLDTTGLEIDGIYVKNLLADIGDTAIQTGEAMHYVGENGAFDQTRDALINLLYQLGVVSDGTEILRNKLASIEETKSVFDDVANSMKAISDVQALVADGFAVDAQKAMELAAVYPAILENATLAKDGQLQLNKEAVDSFIAGKKDELNAAIDARIAELEGDKATLIAKKDLAQAQLDMAMAVTEAEGSLDVQLLQNRIDNSNAVTQALIGMGMDEADAYRAVVENMSTNIGLFDGNVAEAAAAIAGNMSSASASMATSFNGNVRLMNAGMNILVGNAHEVAKAVDAMGRGEVAGAVGYTDGGGNGQSINTFGKKVSKIATKGVGVSYKSRSVVLKDIINNLNADISAYQSAIASIDGQIAALQSLRNSVGKSSGSGSGSGSKGGSGGGGGGGGGSGSGSSSKEETWFEKLLKQHQHYVNMDKETQADFLKWLDKAYKEAYKQGIITLDEFYKYEEQVYNGFKQIESEAESTMDSLIQYRIKMLEQDISNQKDALNKELDDLQKFYSKQKELLQKAADDKKYIEEQGEKRKNVTDIQAQLDQLKYDNSAWAQKRRAELQEQLIDAEKELQDFEDEHALEVALEALDAELEAKQAEIDAEMEALEETLNDPNALYNQALADIQGNTQELYDEMIEYNRKFGDGLDETVKALWESAYIANEQYKLLNNGVGVKGITLGNYTGYTAPTSPDQSVPTSNSKSSSSNNSSSSKPSQSSSQPSLSAGSTITVKRTATNFSPKSGSVRMASFVPGGQYTVYQTSGNEVLIGRGGVYTGWIYKSDIVGYAKGTKSATPGLHRINEEGTEAIFTSSDGGKYRMFSGGEKVLNAKATNFLYEFAMAGSEILDKMRGAASGSFRNIGTINQPISINMGDIVINGDTNQMTVSEIRRAQREQINDVLKSFNRYQLTVNKATK